MGFFLGGLTVVLMLAVAAVTLAIHDNPDRLIQMDRDGLTATNPTLGAEDWENVCPNNQPNGFGDCTGNTTARSPAS